MSGFVRAAAVIDVLPGRGLRVEVNGKAVALFNVEGEFFALEDSCPHRGNPLSNGILKGYELRCTSHGAVFDVKTGAVLKGPAARNAVCYPVRVVGDDVEIDPDGL